MEDLKGAYERYVGLTKSDLKARRHVQAKDFRESASL
jgi:hypothetical protein